MNFCKNIMWSPLDYENAAIIAYEAGDEMLARLDWMTLNPKKILDIGCGTGFLSRKLKKRYPHAQMIAIDSSTMMLDHTKNFLDTCICAEAEKLPLADQSIDFIFANFLVPWHANFKQLLREWQRVLNPDGLLMFSTFGLETLKGYGDILADYLIPQFNDIHDIGDELIREDFTDPVLEVSHYTVTYSNQKKLLEELVAAGMLVSKGLELDGLKPAKDATWSVTYEVIFAHAFAPKQKQSTSSEVKVPLSQLRKTIRTTS